MTSLTTDVIINHGRRTMRRFLEKRKGYHSMARTSWIATDKATAADGVIAFTFTDGTARQFDVRTLSPELQLRLAVHGAEQKLRDNVASASKDGLTVSDVIGETDDLWAQFESGQFTTKSEGGGGESVSLLAAAMVRLTEANPAFGKGKLVGMNVAEVEKYLRESKTKEQRKAFRSVPDIVTTMAEIQAERKRAAAATAAPVDLAAMDV